MKKFLFASVAFSLVLQSLAVWSSQIVKVSEKTKVPVQITKTLSSASSQIGSKVEAEVAEDVIVNNLVVIKKGTPVTAVIANVTRARQWGVGGGLAITINSTKSVDEQKVNLSGGLSRDAYDNKFWNGPLIRGSNQTIAKGTIIPSEILEEIEIQGTEPEQTEEIKEESKE